MVIIRCAGTNRASCTRLCYGANVVRGRSGMQPRFHRSLMQIITRQRGVDSDWNYVADCIGAIVVQVACRKIRKGVMAAVRQLGKEDILFVAGETDTVYHHTVGTGYPGYQRLSPLQFRLPQGKGD